MFKFIFLLFIKASKVLALGIVVMPLAGCALATGIVFAALVRGIAYAPDLEETLFNYTTLGFAFVESFAFLVLGMGGLIFAL